MNFEKPQEIVPAQIEEEVDESEFYVAEVKKSEAAAGVPWGNYAEKAILRTPSLDANHEPTYKSFDDGMEEVRNYGSLGVDLRNPEKGMSLEINMLRKKIQEKLPRELQDERLRYFTAVGTSLDIHHGIDCFFQVGDHVVTVDVSLRDKGDIFKADVLLVMDDERGLTEELIEGYADQIASKFSQLQDKAS